MAATPMSRPLGPAHTWLLFAIPLLTFALLPALCHPAFAEAEDKIPTVINFYNWDEYVGSHTLEKFEAATGIRVNLVTFEDEEQALAMVQADASDADLVVVSESLVPEMVQAKLLTPLDYSKIPNFSHIKPEYLNPPYDPDQLWTVPYLAGTTGLAVNTRYVSEEEIGSWKPLFNERYAGKIGMLNNPWEAMAPASVLLGFGIEPESEAEVDAVAAMMFMQRPLIAGYLDPVTLTDKMISGELWLAEIYSGEGAWISEANEDVVYLVPAEGAPRWVDLLVIPRGSLHVEEAHALINFLHDPEIAAEIASEMWQPTPNGAAEALMDPEALADPQVYPPAGVRERLEFYNPKIDRGETIRRTQKLWSDLNAPG